MKIVKGRVGSRFFSCCSRQGWAGLSFVPHLITQRAYWLMKNEERTCEQSWALDSNTGSFIVIKLVCVYDMQFVVTHFYITFCACMQCFVSIRRKRRPRYFEYKQVRSHEKCTKYKEDKIRRDSQERHAKRFECCWLIRMHCIHAARRWLLLHGAEACVYSHPTTLALFYRQL